MINTAVLRRAMHAIADKKGEFTLFALLRRADALGTWDLVVSAPWLGNGQLKATREFVRLFAQSAGKDFLQQLARVVALKANDAPVKFILENLPVEDRVLRVKSTDLLGLEIEEAIIFQAKKPHSNGLPNRSR